MNTVTDSAAEGNPDALPVDAGPDFAPESPLAILREHGFIGVDEFVAQADTTPPWLVDGLLTAGGLSVVVAKPKVGKSVLVRNLALAVACGSPFLERTTQQGAVIYLAIEEKEAGVRGHFQRLGSFRCKDRLFLRFGYPSKDVFQELAPILEAVKPALLIVDTLFGARTVKDESSYAQMTAALAPINALARKTGT